ncbi:gamma-glutamylcyclotransferase [Microcoleus sp. FACHB-831]|uniref:gamma-glutamylcyclotransferase n=1 Tax=Microcoleus sp. FACHB-831 TaxID=2692827 RepID=UPI001682B27D|nr:gamma-glutamylcyclotransferase [Microcoleus sp. FACHB-831]MBD1924321.1 gamma-glutamylcyclotransferase [Microcoleus sp. FACHB-831]
MSVQPGHLHNSLHLYKPSGSWQQQQPTEEPTFYYFAYGSCMCPVDLKRTMGENTHSYVVGSATLKGYRLGFYCRSSRRNCGVLDVVKDPTASVQGVLYRLPMRLSDRLDEREEVHLGGYRHEMVNISCNGQMYTGVRTYVVVNKLPEELAPNDWYFNVVLRGALTCGLPEQYCWQLFNHMHRLQQQKGQTDTLRSA